MDEHHNPYVSSVICAFTWGEVIAPVARWSEMKAKKKEIRFMEKVSFCYDTHTVENINEKDRLHGHAKFNDHTFIN